MSMGTIKLTKPNAQLKLTKDAGINLRERVIIGMSWDAEKVPGAKKIDLDLMCIMSIGDNVNDVCISIDHFMSPSFNTAFRLEDKTPVVVMSKDNKDGEDRPENEYELVFGSAFKGVKTDDEYLAINFQNIPAEIKRVTIPANIFDGKDTFGSVENAKISVYGFDGREAVRCDLSKDVAAFDTVNFVQFDRAENGDWTMKYLAKGFNASIEEMVISYGLDLTEYAKKYAPWALK